MTVLALQPVWEPIGSPAGPSLGGVPALGLTVSYGYVEILPRIVGYTWLGALCARWYPGVMGASGRGGVPHSALEGTLT